MNASTIVAQPLTAEMFAPFGQVFCAPSEPSRFEPPLRLENRRSNARPMFSMLKVEPRALPLTIETLERHPHSSQTFVPMRVKRYLVVVAPHAADGAPDTSQLRAFIAAGNQGVSYDADTWHHGLTVLDARADFAVFMWNDGTDEDTEFRPLPAKITITEVV